jgi:hypothetical protein
MTEEVIAHMRARIERTRRVISLAHAQEMIAALEAMIESAARRWHDDIVPFKDVAYLPASLSV